MDYNKSEKFIEEIFPDLVYFGPENIEIVNVYSLADYKYSNAFWKKKIFDIFISVI